MPSMLESLSGQGERIARAQSVTVGLLLTLVFLQPLFSHADRPQTLTPEEAAASVQLSANPAPAPEQTGTRHTIRVP